MDLMFLIFNFLSLDNAMNNSITPFAAFVLDNTLSAGAEVSAKYILPPFLSIDLFMDLAKSSAAPAVLAQK